MVLKSSILNLIKTFSKYSTLRSEMADRIMYSTIPHFNPERAKLTDIPAMERAVNGAKKLIRYGTLVCVDELRYYDKESEMPTITDIPKIVDKNSIERFIDILNTSENLFGDYKNWGSAYGGKSWEKIARSTKDLAIAYGKYLNENDYNQKIELGKMVIVYMNALDGLAHNTGSLYDKLVSKELINDLGATDGYREKGRECHKIKNLMNVKELKNPQDVVEEVEKELELPIIFKDYLSVARQQKLKNPSDIMPADQRKLHLNAINDKKQVKKYVDFMTGKIVKVKELAQEQINTNYYYAISDMAKDMIYYIYNIAKTINDYLCRLLAVVDIANEYNTEVIKQQEKKLYNIKSQFDQFVNMTTASIKKEHMEQMLVFINQTLEQLEIIQNTL